MHEIEAGLAMAWQSTIVGPRSVVLFNSYITAKNKILLDVGSFPDFRDSMLVKFGETLVKFPAKLDRKKGCRTWTSSASHPTFHQPFPLSGDKEKNNNPMKQTLWNAITCAVCTCVYSVYCILLDVLLRATKVPETLVPSTVRPFSSIPARKGSSDQICITNCAAKCGTWMGSEGPGWEVTHGFFARPKRIIESWSEWTTVSELFFFWKVYYSRRDPCGYCTWLFLSYRFQNMYTSHFTHLACVLYLAFCCWYCDLIRAWYRCVCYSFFTAQHLISTSYTISSKKTISGEVDKDINFFVTSIPVFVSYIKSRRPTLLPLKGTKIEEQEHELQNLNSAIAAKVMGFCKKT